MGQIHFAGSIGFLPEGFFPAAAVVAHGGIFVGTDGVSEDTDSGLAAAQAEQGEEQGEERTEIMFS